MAIRLVSVAKNDQVRNLLHETQTQSEELQAQQEELRQSNDELQSRQEELESINEELEEQQSLLRTQKTELDEKNAELEAAQMDLTSRASDLERVGKYKSEFLANMSHELRTPLNSQLILSKLLAENKEGNLSEKQIQFAKTIHETGLDLLQLINDILDLAKVEAGKLSLEIRPTPLQEIIGGLERDFRAVAESRKLKFSVHADSSLPEHLTTDSHRLLQVLRNFLSNAFKFTEKGEVSLSIARWGEGSRKDQVAFRVKDTGIGIPEDKHELVFQAFEQVDSATTRQYGGTGLGLAISKQISEILGGEIRMVSEAGRGSEFILIVPEVLQGEAPLAREKKIQQPLRVVQRASKVLLVDDDVLLQKQIEESLRENRHEATVVTTAGEALKQLSQNAYDCIILDIRLPDMSGFEFLRKIRAGADAPPPVIIYTAMELNRGEEEELHRASASIIIKGPKSAERLMDEVRQLVQKEEAPKKTAAAKGGAMFKGQKVLLVDDDIRNIFALTSALEEQGLAVAIARDGREALEVLAQNPDIHLVLMDVMMPVMDGYEATRKIKGDGKFANVPVIALTAKAMKEDKELCLAAGANDYLPKPVNLDRLFALISVWVRN
jgi:two-component system chemotaxis sensor kinase CheA